MTIAIGHTKVAAMPSGPGERYDFFLSRRGSVAYFAVWEKIGNDWKLECRFEAQWARQTTVASKATLLAVVVALTIDTRTARWRIDNARSYRPTKPPADHSRCGAPGPRVHVRVLARRRAGMDPAATRGLRTGRDPALPAVHLGHWPCQVVHVPLPSLPQPRLPCRVRRRCEEEGETL